MKRILFLALAMGLTLGSFAQKTVKKDTAANKARVTAAADTLKAKTKIKDHPVKTV